MTFNILRYLVAICLIFPLLSGCEKPPSVVEEKKPLSTIEISCDRPGASVEIDGVHKGKCPLKVMVEAGDHNIKLLDGDINAAHYIYNEKVFIGENVIQPVNARLAWKIAGNYERGKNIFMKGIGDTPDCSNCHGNPAMEKDLGITPIFGMEENKIIISLNDFKSNKREDEKMFVMNTYAKGLSSQNIADVATYISNTDKSDQ